MSIGVRREERLPSLRLALRASGVALGRSAARRGSHSRGVTYKKGGPEGPPSSLNECWLKVSGYLNASPSHAPAIA
jgi:hypothetical protein